MIIECNVLNGHVFVWVGDQTSIPETWRCQCGRYTNWDMRVQSASELVREDEARNQVFSLLRE